jgi:aminopeptidase YwaD
MNASSRLIAVLLAALSGISAFAEDVPHVRDDAKRIVQTLASPEMWGRGYTRGGMGKAQAFLEKEIHKIGLAPLAGDTLRQPFTYPVVTFPGKMEVRLNDRLLVPGVDYIVNEGTPGGKGEGMLVKTDDTHFTDAGKFNLVFTKKLTWSVAGKKLPVNTIYVDVAKFTDVPTHYSYNIESTLIPVFNANNLAAVVKGTTHPDRYFVFMAHYDHLGSMGTEAYFPGANDNASGVSLLLSLAKYYQAHPQPYSIAFLFFAGEEAGLIGSRYFVEHPLIPLTQIRFAMNFDIEGTGNAGATIVNAVQFPAEFATLQKINDEGHYLLQIGSRGKAANSDHYWFTEHGVPAFFMYTQGGIQAYHDVFDKSETLPLDKIDDVFALTLKFSQKIAEEGLDTPAPTGSDPSGK